MFRGNLAVIIPSELFENHPVLPEMRWVTPFYW
jgi:hypothetical protein